MAEFCPKWQSETMASRGNQSQRETLKPTQSLRVSIKLLATSSETWTRTMSMKMIVGLTWDQPIIQLLKQHQHNWCLAVHAILSMVIEANGSTFMTTNNKSFVRTIKERSPNRFLIHTMLETRYYSIYKTSRQRLMQSMTAPMKCFKSTTMVLSAFVKAQYLTLSTSASLLLVTNNAQQHPWIVGEHAIDTLT